MAEVITYLDWAATALLRPEAACAMAPYLTAGAAGAEYLGNANSLHEVGRDAFRALEQAREVIARSIQARPDELIFTSGATEADNAALFGLVQAVRRRFERQGKHAEPMHVVVSSIEHDAVLHAARVLEQQGVAVTYVNPTHAGFITPQAVVAAMNEHTVLVSIMAVNNEIGSVMDVAALASAVHERGALFHTDATQALGKISVSAKAWGVDALSLSSHKVGGPKGIGALYLKARTPFEAQLVGGGQEMDRRSGTQNVMGAVGFAAACEACVNELPEETKRLRVLRDELYARLTEYDRVIPSVEVAPCSQEYAPHIVNVVVRGIESQTLILKLDRLGVCISGGSACSSHSLDPSHVLLTLGIARSDALGSLRISLGFATTHEDIERFLQAFACVVQ